ncbi:GMC family oxidoreductase N-terminal domain-containing protein [Citricoccus sp. I39-566]|uniref:GMC family oxidoreductase N-terminal domain-containing protein n=1 Tax=Citricoccus sp. I39-566 TaxID=3073268 RepID=UPI00286D2223|nr:GMC family oxidoreductase N-terminal domain-containing protein [Citricoccus sp. I39-566]WMY79310.1 GMC family oxidoreductase N-terminal domain-containing protein [Citricoccus sp. I39-566]
MSRHPDVIVVGAGGAGAPFAARISEDPACSVLVLEAGPVPSTPADFPADVLDATALPTVNGPGPHSWWYRSEVAPGRDYDVGRGQGAGGSTAVNGAYFVRPRITDLRRWAAAGNPEWAPDRVLPVLARLERDVQFAGAPGHGGSGPVPVDRRAFAPSALAAAFSTAATARGHRALPDLNDLHALAGHGELPLNVQEGVRMNTGLTYLLPAMDRPNLTVRGHASVRRVLISGGRATGVEAEIEGRVHRISAGEVVLAAGAVRSPHLLMLSGIGPAEDLTAAGLRPVVDSPGVGASCSDHADLTVLAPLSSPLRPGGKDPLFSWALNWTAEGAGGSAGGAGGSADGVGGSEEGAGALEVLPMLRPFPVLAGAEEGSELPVIVALQGPTSRGQLSLDPANPESNPRVHYRHLESAVDRHRMREGVRTAVDLLASEELGTWVDTAAWDRSVFEEDQRLDDWMIEHLGTAVHLSGTAPMGPEDAPGTVTDQYGRVHGVQGLRVVDTSILPDVPSRGPAATAVLLGEHLAGLMLGAGG